MEEAFHFTERRIEAHTHMPQKLTPEIIAAAVVGFERQKERIDAQIADLRAMLPGSNTHADSTGEKAERPKRKISAAARRRMALGQKARWAKLKEESESPAPVAMAEASKPKRKLSAAGKKAISEATKKRWQAFHAAKQKVKPAAPAKKAIAERRLSPARKAALVANLAKARAAKAAKATAGPQ
jgi:hypothetical protein